MPSEPEPSSSPTTSPTAGPTSPRSAPAPSALPPRRRTAAAAASQVRLFLALVFGVLAPVVAVFVEAATSICADTFFDPLPTPVHTILWLLVPLTNLALWIAAVRDVPLPRLVAGPVWGAALGVALWYSLPFGVLAPLSLIAILMAGLGFLSLSPLTALWVSWRLREPDRAARRGALAGAAGALLLLCVADLPAAAAHVAIVRAAGTDRDAAASALAFLRTSVPSGAVLTAAERQPSVMSPLGVAARYGWRWRSDAASDVAWRATGEEPHRDRMRRGGFLAFDDDFEGAGLDRDQGGGVVGRPVPGLCVASSRVEGDVLAGAGVADLAWDLTFRNVSQFDAEARALVTLPEGAVVSDATLWVAGEPRDAVFASRAKAKKVYEEIVAVRRDPLLVTSDGPGRAMVQCFPVPRAGGEMRIRIRVAAPLADPHGEGAALEMPRFSARNFAVCDGADHVVLLRTDGPVASLPEGFAVRLGDDRTSEIRALGGAAEFVDAGGRIVFADGGAGATDVAADDPFPPGGTLVARRVERVVEPPSRLVVVVDTSGAAAASRGATEELLRALPDGAELAVIAASDRVEDLTGGVVPLSSETRRRVGDRLAALPWAGGVDSLPALRAAVNLVATDARARVLWLHGPQTRMPDGRAPGEPPRGIVLGCALRPVDLTGLRVAAGANVVAETRDLVPTYEEWAGSGDPSHRVAELVRRWYGRPKAQVLDVEWRPAPPPGTVAAPGGAARPLAALWAAREASRLAAGGGSFDEAVRLAASHRVVTPVTAALVLETDEQVRQAGLDGVEPGSLPTVPEPGEWAVIALLAGAGVFAWLRRRRRVVVA